MIERDEKAPKAEDCFQLVGGGGVLIRSAAATRVVRPVRNQVRQLAAPAAPVEPR